MSSLTESNLSRWAQVISDTSLATLVGRVETDSHGKIILSPPPSAHHGSYQFQIGVLVNELIRGGRVITECPISTADGVKAADVAWASNQRIAELGEQVCFPHAPEICVEILSPANTDKEIKEKTALWFDAGALEVWLCDVFGNLVFLNAGREQPSSASQICPRFPAQVRLSC